VGQEAQRSRQQCRLLVGVVVLLLVAASACEKPDASDVTSPSALSLLGTTRGAATYGVTGPLPPLQADAEGWVLDLGNARFATLENGQASIQVVTQIQALNGAAMELWVHSGEESVLHWVGGETERYNGVVCFQLRLEDGDESLQLADTQYWLTMAFRDTATGEYVVVQEERVAGTLPRTDGALPGPGSRVGSELLGCPRSVI